MIEHALRSIRPKFIVPSKRAFFSLLLSGAMFVPHAEAAEARGQKNSSGLAWRVIGSWRIAGNARPLSDGDFVPPTALLQPLEDSQKHSVTILLPDGQRVLYECFTSRDCERGFRVPALYREASATETDLLNRVNAVETRKGSPANWRQQDETAGSRDEAVARVGAGNQVEVGGLAASLSDGTYSYTVRSDGEPSAKEVRGSFAKHGLAISLSVPSEGLFDVLIYDQLNLQRIDLLLAAAREPRATKLMKSFQDVGSLLKDWNEDYQGWPAHEIKRAYLRSVMLGIGPAVEHPVKSSSETVKAADAACEPTFDPAPGLFKGDIEVKLQCADPQATIRYTVDASQPLEGAAVYRAPIVVKGTALMIKAFASAPGKKDSPVVTGIFRISE